MSDNLHLVARVGQSWVAMPAERIEAVVRVADVVPVPGAPAVVGGLVAIRSRILTLIDTGQLVGETGALAPYMAIVTMDGHGYALTLDEIDDVTVLSAFAEVPAPLSAGWAQLQPEMADHRGEALLVLDPDRMIGAAGQILSAAA
jgi:purine-binding chemotaxis protein CheW